MTDKVKKRLNKYQLLARELRGAGHDAWAWRVNRLDKEHRVVVKALKEAHKNVNIINEYE